MPFISNFRSIIKSKSAYKVDFFLDKCILYKRFLLYFTTTTNHKTKSRSLAWHANRLPFGILFLFPGAKITGTWRSAPETSTDKMWLTVVTEARVAGDDIRALAHSLAFLFQPCHAWTRGFCPHTVISIKFSVAHLMIIHQQLYQ